MKRVIKGLSLFIAVLSLLIISSVNVNALVEQTSYVRVNDNTQSLIVGDLSF